MAADNIRLNTPYFSRFVVQTLGLTILFTQKYVDFNVRRTDSCEEILDGEVERVLREVGQ